MPCCALCDRCRIERDLKLNRSLLLSFLLPIFFIAIGENSWPVLVLAFILNFIIFLNVI